MPQICARLSSHSAQENSITLVVGGKYVEYIVSDNFPYHLGKIRYFLEQEWTNYAVAWATKHSKEIYLITPGRARFHLNQVSVNIQNYSEEAINVGTTDYSKTPSAEYPFTVVAPKAQGITYRGERQWFKTADDARIFAQSVYDGEPSKNFELCIVKCEDVVKPKPKTELISTWSKQEG